MANDIEKNGEPIASQAAGQIVKLTSGEMARSMMFKYAEKIVGDERAQEFFTQVGFLMRSNPAIAKCSPESIFNACMQSVNLDLMPNTPEHYCSLIPYAGELTFQLEYRGGIELAYRSGIVKTIKADVVFPEDVFEVDDAMNTISHKKNLTIDRTKAEKITAAYAVAKLDNGEIMFEVMSPSEIKKIKDKAVKAKKPGTPWSEWEERMIRKSPLKRLFTVLPNSRSDNRFKIAAAWDNAAEGGKKLKVDMDSGKIIEGDLVENELPQDVIIKIDEADSPEMLSTILKGLTVEQKKKAAPLALARQEELAKEAKK